MRIATTRSFRLSSSVGRSLGCACRHHSTNAASHKHLAPEDASTTPENARLRFAPSPTGYLHLGGLRTALFNHILARKWGGKWLLRIEDTDQSRLVPGSVDALCSALEWAGLDYDEGVGAGGNLGPYTQSERTDIYRHYANELVDKGAAYECFCTPDELAAIRAGLRASGTMKGYDGRCRHLSRDEVRRNKEAGKPYVVRFKMDPSMKTMPDDLIFGSGQPIGSQEDFILLKSDGFPTYHLASVVDDHLMQISHVFRGEEWLPSVEKHHQLYRAFGWSPPKFGHLPLLCNEDGTKLSKRSGDVDVAAHKAAGYEPEALVNFLGLMGWDHHAALERAVGDDGALPYHVRHDNNSYFEVFTMPQLISAFDLGLVNHRRAAVSMAKLDFLNRMTLRRKAERTPLDTDHPLYVGKPADGVESERETLVRRFQEGLKALPELEGSTLIDDLPYVERVFDIELPRANKLNEMAPKSLYFFKEPTYEAPEVESFFGTLKPTVYVDGIAHILSALNARQKEPFTESLANDLIKSAAKALKIKKKSELMLPLRHALTGEKSGPMVAELMETLGRDRVVRRLKEGRAYAVRKLRG